MQHKKIQSLLFVLSRKANVLYFVSCRQ